VRDDFWETKAVSDKPLMSHVDGQHIVDIEPARAVLELFVLSQVTDAVDVPTNCGLFFVPSDMSDREGMVVPEQTSAYQSAFDTRKRLCMELLQIYARTPLGASTSELLDRFKSNLIPLESSSKKAVVEALAEELQALGPELSDEEMAITRGRMYPEKFDEPAARDSWRDSGETDITECRIIEDRANETLRLSTTELQGQILKYSWRS